MLIFSSLSVFLFAQNVFVSSCAPISSSTKLSKPSTADLLGIKMGNDADDDMTTSSNMLMSDFDALVCKLIIVKI